MTPAEKTVADFVNAFAKADYKTIENTLSENVISHVTNASGGTEKIIGRDHYLQKVRAMNIEAVNPSINITQIASIKPEQIMVMVEVKARANEQTLHNFAAHLINIEHGKIKEMWMVEALPAYSNTFWKP